MTSGSLPTNPEVEVVAVDVNGLEAQAWTVGGLASIQWDLGDGTSVLVDARELSTDEVIEFARGLRLQPDGLGFDATVRPQGITEIPLDQAESSTELPQRQLGLLSTDESSVVDVVVSGGDASAFEALAADRVASASGGQVEQLRVLGRPAVLAGDLAAEPHLMWRHTTTDIVEIVFAVSDRAELDAFIAGIREISEDEWQELLATYD